MKKSEKQKKKDSEHLEFIYNRLSEVHGENHLVDYMIRFRNIIYSICDTEKAATNIESQGYRDQKRLIERRDYLEERSTELAEQVGNYFDVAMGEHTSNNCPVDNAIEHVSGLNSAKHSTEYEVMPRHLMARLMEVCKLTLETKNGGVLIYDETYKCPFRIVTCDTGANLPMCDSWKWPCRVKQSPKTEKRWLWRCVLESGSVETVEHLAKTPSTVGHAMVFYKVRGTEKEFDL